MAERKLTQTQILQQLGIPTTPAELADIEGNGKLQQYINQQAGLHHLPEPFDPSTASAIIQDLLPIAALAGGGAVAASSEAAAAATTAEAATAGGAAGAAGTVASDIAKAAALGGIAALITDPSFLFRLLKFVGGLLLAYIGIKQLAGAGGSGSSSRRLPVTV